MDRQLFGKNIHGWIDDILAISVLFLPLYQIVSISCWLVLIFIWLLSGQAKDTLKNLKLFPALIFFFALYVFYVAGMLWTENVDAGFEDLRIKIPLLLFPLLFSSLNFSRESFPKICKALVAGCAIALLICFGRSLKLYIDTGDAIKFFYTSFSIFLHPTYFTMYLGLALLMICSETFSDDQKIFPGEKIRTALFFLLITGVILLNARLAMVTVFFTLLLFVLLEALKRYKLRRMFSRFLIQAILIAGIFFSLIRLNNRFVQISDVMHNQKDTTAILDTATNVYYNSTLIRMGLLKNSIQVFQNNFLFGVGTGDVMPESVKELSHSHLDYLAKHFTGAHNQYLQTAMSLGIFGLVLLILCIVYPLKEYWRQKNYLAVCFCIIVLINAMGDTILRASSLYFFVFFGCYLYTFNKRFG